MQKNIFANDLRSRSCPYHVLAATMGIDNEVRFRHSPLAQNATEARASMMHASLAGNVRFPQTGLGILMHMMGDVRQLGINLSPKYELTLREKALLLDALYAHTELSKIPKLMRNLGAKLKSYVNSAEAKKLGDGYLKCFASRGDKPVDVAQKEVNTTLVKKIRSIMLEIDPTLTSDELDNFLNI